MNSSGAWVRRVIGLLFASFSLIQLVLILHAPDTPSPDKTTLSALQPWFFWTGRLLLLLLPLINLQQLLAVQSRQHRSDLANVPQKPQRAFWPYAIGLFSYLGLAQQELVYQGATLLLSLSSLTSYRLSAAIFQARTTQGGPSAGPSAEFQHVAFKQNVLVSVLICCGWMALWGWWHALSWHGYLLLLLAAWFCLCYVFSTGFLLLALQNHYRELYQMRSAMMEYAQASLKLQEAFGPSQEETSMVQEIHDSIGHVLTAVLMQLRNLVKLQERRIFDRTIPLLSELAEYVQASIHEVRTVLHKAHLGESPQQDWLQLWHLVCKMFATTTGIQIDLCTPEQLHSTGTKEGEVIYRVLQEALTNAVRHGHATYIEISFRVRPDIKGGRLLLLISDNGVGVARTFQLGIGLKAMRERVQDLSGEISFNTQPSRGFDIGISLPYKSHQEAQ